MSKKLMALSSEELSENAVKDLSCQKFFDSY
jgi:hypothetical protein